MREMGLLNTSRVHVLDGVLVRVGPPPPLGHLLVPIGILAGVQNVVRDCRRRMKVLSDGGLFDEALQLRDLLLGLFGIDDVGFFVLLFVDLIRFVQSLILIFCVI